MTKKWGGGNCARQIFQKHMNSARKKCWEKIVGKNCDKSFFIFTRISCSQKGTKKCAKQFFQKHTNSASKKSLEKNRRKKVQKTFFYIHTNIVKKIGGKKTRGTIFPETHE